MKKILVITGVVVLLAGAAYGVLYFLNKKGVDISIDLPGLKSDSDAVKAGKKLSNGQCEGEGVTNKLSVSPMKAEDFSMIIPYGLMIGGHVTPIDHQYFSPTIFTSPRDTYEVRAMADSTIVDLQPRTNERGTEYRFVFTITCTYFYYYDLVTSLTPELKKVFDESQGGTFKKSMNYQVKAGELVGRIGGQTLDFAVWDTTKPLSGFIVPEHYERESWKIYTADPLDYYTDELKSLLLSKYVRTAEPRSGKIDYDIDGKLIGNWFYEGTDYGGPIGEDTGQLEYWEGHLAIAPDHYDPTAYIFSVGNLEGPGKQNQFSVPRSAPDPAQVGVEKGLVKYELKNWNYLKSDGSSWDRFSYTNGLTLSNDDTESRGCALAQLIETRKLKFETFMGQSCGNVTGFSSAARIYTR